MPAYTTQIVDAELGELLGSAGAGGRSGAMAVKQPASVFAALSRQSTLSWQQVAERRRPVRITCLKSVRSGVVPSGARSGAKA